MNSNIKISITDRQIHLSNLHISYVIAIHEGKLMHQYFGPHLKHISLWEPQDPCSRSFRTEHEGFGNLAFDEIPFEFPEDNQGDYRQESIALSQADHEMLAMDFRFHSCRVHDSLLSPEGLPGAHCKDGQEARTLEVIVEDSRSGIQVSLFYGLIEDLPGILRWNRITNLSAETLHLKHLASFSLDLPDFGQKLLHLAGSHLAEGQMHQTDLTPGVQVLESRRGVSSSQHPPFAALVDPKSSAFHGNIISAQLVYSGNHRFTIQKEYPGGLRVSGGINPWRFSWQLAPGASFSTPQAAVFMTSEGLNGMAQAWHHFYLDHILRSPDRMPEILLNSWEAMYYRTTEENLGIQMQEAARLGIECYVVDDGWFRTQDNSRSPIGDWQVCREKLPHGLNSIAAQAEAHKMSMGLWVEPEAVSMNSRLYQEHPEWILQVPGKVPIASRHELLLNLALDEVQDHLIRTLERIIQESGASYLKWDMNRPLTDLPDGETAHRYVLGLYRVLDFIRTSYPEIRIEGCSSGGSRLDGGMFYYVDQNWTTDNTDPFDRLSIQQGMALMFPPQILTAHVSASPNHQTGRISSLDTRFNLCRFFNPGYELNLQSLTDEEKEALKAQILQFKQERPWMKQAEFYMHDEKMWSKYDSQTDRVEILIFQDHINRLASHARYRIPYLPADHLYELRPQGRIYSGAELAWHGFELKLVPEDFHVYPLTLTPVQPQATEGDQNQQ